MLTIHAAADRGRNKPWAIAVSTSWPRIASVMLDRGNLLRSNPGWRHATASLGLPWAKICNAFGARIDRIACTALAFCWGIGDGEISNPHPALRDRPIPEGEVDFAYASPNLQTSQVPNSGRRRPSCSCRRWTILLCI